MSPLLGLHTVLGILAAWIFRLNKMATIVGVYVTNPWTIVPIYSFSIWIGAKILRYEHIIPDIYWKDISIMEFLRSFEPILLPFVVGTTLVGVLSALISYFVIYHTARKNRG